MKAGIIFTLFAALVTVASNAMADWQVMQTSSITYVSTKNNLIAENNQFTTITGGITSKGQANLRIDLSSVETHVEIRNQRMRDIFFEVTDYPEAVITAQLQPQDLAHIESGAPLDIDLPLTISLHGVTAETSAKLRAAKFGQRIWVSAREPLLISARDFGLEAGVAALQEIAGLNGIAGTVPVTIDLRLRTE